MADDGISVEHSAPLIICQTRTRSLSFSQTTVSRQSSTVSSHSINSSFSKRFLSTRSLDGNFRSSVNIANERIIQNDHENIEDAAWICGYTKKQFKIFITLCLLSFVDVMGYSIFAPFFPNVAEKNGLSSSKIGIIFSAYSIAGIFSSIIAGSILVNVGPKFIILSGMFLSAGSLLCFSALENIPTTTFFILCVVCRVFMGVGASAAYTAMFAVIFQQFESNALTVIGVSESLCGVGGIIGPLFGGILYQEGGFALPFVFLGAVQVVVLLLSAYTLPHVKIERQTKKVVPLRLLTDFHAVYASLLVVMAFATNSFITANLSLFLEKEFEMNATMIGVVFLVFSALYAIATPLWGYLADMRGGSGFLIIIGCFILGVSMATIGPAHFMLDWFGYKKQRLWLMYCSCALAGVSFGALLMPTFGEMLIGAKKIKVHSSVLAEYGLVSGLWNFSFSIGDILGPTVGGAVCESIGFANTSAYCGGIILFMGLLKIMHLLVKKYCNKREIESTRDVEVSSPHERTSLLST